jgi:hypothetical protein
VLLGAADEAVFAEGPGLALDAALVSALALVLPPPVSPQPTASVQAIIGTESATRTELNLFILLPPLKGLANGRDKSRSPFQG